MSLSVDVIPNRTSPPAILLREAWRDGKRIRRRTIANLSKMPPFLIDAIRLSLAGGVTFPSLNAAVDIRRSLPYGHIAAVLGTLQSLGLIRVFGRKSERMRDLLVAAVIARVVDPTSQLSVAQTLSPETASTSLEAVLELGQVSDNEVLLMLDWLLKRKPWIERSLANRHLKGENTLLLYNVSSSNRDEKKNKRQITYGLLCSADGCPVALKVFAGNTGESTTVASQVDTVRKRFGIDRVAFVGDRGMLKTARIRKDMKSAELDWVSALKSGDIRKLIQEDPMGVLAPLTAEELVLNAVAEVISTDFPGERLMVCLNPRLRHERARKRTAFLHATEEVLETIAAAVRSGRLKGKECINRRVEHDINRRKVGKHFTIDVTDEAIVWHRRQDRITAEARLDGIYVIRTSLDTTALGSEAAVEAYKSIARIERAFHMMKATRLKVRPVDVYSENHVRAYMFVCMLAYYLEWHMRQRLAPLLFEDDDHKGARAQRNSPVEPTRVSKGTQTKAITKRTSEGPPVHDFTALLADLATLTLNEVTLTGSSDYAFPLLATPTELQNRAFDLLEIDPANYVDMSVAG